MSSRVVVRIPKERPTWRSVIVCLPINFELVGKNKKALKREVYGKDIVRRWVRQIAREAGIPLVRTRCATHILRGQYRGYVLVYSGYPTALQKKLFSQVRKIAERVTKKPKFRELDRYPNLLSCPPSCPPYFNH